MHVGHMNAGTGLQRTDRRKAARPFETDCPILHAEGKQGNKAVMRLPYRFALHVPLPPNARYWWMSGVLSNAEECGQGEQKGSAVSFDDLGHIGTRR